MWRSIVQQVNLAGASEVQAPSRRQKLPLNALHPSIHHLVLTHSVRIMSRASQITLATTCIGAIGIVAAVHYGQKIEKAVCLFLAPLEIYYISNIS